MQLNGRPAYSTYPQQPPPVIQSQRYSRPSRTTKTEEPKLTRELEVVDLNTYSSRKSAIGGALGVSLFTSNTDQLVTLINAGDTWSNLQNITFWLILISLLLQVS